MELIKTNKNNKVFAFFREKDENRVIVFLNLSKKSLAIKPRLENLKGGYSDYFSKINISIPLTDSLRLDPWGYKVFVR
jgi:Txe/YoeB family toxin of Txe-Axe toxin-antitoxin module